MDWQSIIDYNKVQSSEINSINYMDNNICAKQLGEQWKLEMLKIVSGYKDKTMLEFINEVYYPMIERKRYNNYIKRRTLKK